MHKGRQKDMSNSNYLDTKLEEEITKVISEETEISLNEVIF